jgi:alkylated DNA repair dioxygenase AlkB
VRHVTGKPFNFVLMNLYAPADSIGKHSDDERDLVEGAGIFSVSLGRARLFCLEPKGGGSGARGPLVSQRLAHGSAVWMTGLTQRAYKHHVPAEKMRAGETGPELRVNLTFRCVVERR